jgi:hypothetical protein
MKYAVQIGSDTMIHMRSFIIIRSGIQNLTGGGGGTQISRQVIS